jgi:hypothetical protein
MSNANKLHYIYDSVFAAECPVSNAQILREVTMNFIVSVKN